MCETSLSFCFDCIGEAIRIVQNKLDSKNFYAYNPAFDK